MENQPDKQVKIEVIQAAADAVRKGDYLPPIPLERTSVTGLTHADGVISMARDVPTPRDTSSSSASATRNRSISAARGIRTDRDSPRSAES
jgi:hypothetical protein